MRGGGARGDGAPQHFFLSLVFFFFVFGEKTTAVEKQIFLAIFPRGHKQYTGRVEMEQQIVHVTFTRFSGNWRHMTEGLRTDKV